jgi:hypothetical protein
MTEKLPHMTITPDRPGIIIFDDDPLTGILAGKASVAIAFACNTHDGYDAACRLAEGEQGPDPDAWLERKRDAAP